MAETPTPWTLETVRTSIGHCHKIMPVGACLYVDHRDPRETDQKTATALANAALIIKAVNGRAALRAALEGMLAAYCELALDGTQGAFNPETVDQVAAARRALEES